MNHWSKGLVAQFKLENGRLSLSAEEFEGIGFILEPRYVVQVGSERRVFLDAAPGFTWTLDMAKQSIDISAPYAALQPQKITISPPPARVHARSDWGAILGYDLYGEWADRPNDPIFRRGVSGDVDARLFSPSFTAETTGFYTSGSSATGVTRLDSSIQIQNPDRITNVVIGDSYTSALTWTRSIRFGGVQWQRDFGIRPDIFTQPAPQLAAGVAAPSTVDLFVNGVERYAGGASPGSLILEDLPTMTGANTLNMVLTDPSGRRRDVSLPFYASSDLLAPGLTDFSVEAGAERLDYGIQSFDYGPAFGSATVRRGLTPNFTGALHAEAAEGLAMVGGDATMKIDNALVATASAAGSSGSGGSGVLVALQVERTGPVFSGAIRYVTHTDGFQDLAALFGQPMPSRAGLLTASVRLADNQVLSLAYVLQAFSTGVRTEVATGTYTRSFFNNKLRVDISGFGDLATRTDWGVNLSISFPIGHHSIETAGAASRPAFNSYFVSTNGDAFGGDLSYLARLAGGPETAANIDVGWRGLHADVRARAVQIGPDGAVQVDFGQDLVLFDHALFFSAPVDDAFTVVKLDKTPGVEVFLENRPVGRSNEDGLLFVNHLRGYEANSISINPQDLPLNAATQAFSQVVAPRSGGGVITNFIVNAQRSVIVGLVRADGSPPPAGSRVLQQGATEPIPLGYGGEAYLRDVKPGRNALRVDWEGGSCQASFEAPSDAKGLPRLEGIRCD